MNQVEKMYENAGVEMEFAYLECHRGRSSICCPIDECEKDERCMGCINSNAMEEVYKYPPFTAEKQIKIIKWLSDIANGIDICYDKYKGLYGMQIGLKYSGIGYNNDFAELLASRVNNIWGDLYPKNKEQIREILE